MRAIIALSDGKGFAYWRTEEREKYISAGFSCCQTSTFLSISRKEMKPEVQVARSAAAEQFLEATEKASSKVGGIVKVVVGVANASRPEDIAAAAVAAAQVRNGYHALQRDTDKGKGKQLSTQLVPSKHGFAIDAFPLHEEPLWPNGMSTATKALWERFRADVKILGCKFEIWIDWFQDRMNGADLNFDVELERAARGSNEYFERNPKQAPPLQHNPVDGSSATPSSSITMQPCPSCPLASVERPVISTSSDHGLMTNNIDVSDNSVKTVFISYSHKDIKLRNELEKHLALLRKQQVVSVWHDRKILPGMDWDHEIDFRLEQASIILLLVSANFIDFDYCFGKELVRALERHEAKQATVIPVLLKPCDWIGAPFGKLQGLPEGMTPITEWRICDAAWTAVAKGIRAVAEH